MRIDVLRIENLRIIKEAELRLEPGLNWFIGPNGAGKTSVLEACSLLASGRSFRSVGGSSFLRSGSERSSVFAQLWEPVRQAPLRVGLERDAQDYRGRIDGSPVRSLSELFQHVPMVFVEPDSGQLLHGAGEIRRQFVDWGLFHVEPEFMPAWRRYQRALQQRNLVLRAGGSVAALAPWNHCLLDDGARIHHFRQAQSNRLQNALTDLLPSFLPGFNGATLRIRPGWSQDLSFEEALSRAEDSDRRLGYTTVGPHRFSWTLRFADGTDQQQLSRGQAKLCALAMWLVQLRVFRELRGQAPMLGLDDVMAELDPSNQIRVIEFLHSTEVQCLLTRADRLIDAPQQGQMGALFHVEQGVVRRQL